MSWLSRLLGGQPAAKAAVRPAAVAGPGDAPPKLAGAKIATDAAAAEGPPFLCWLFGTPLAEPGLTPQEQQALTQIDQVLAQPALPPELLPRAASVVPQLIAMLRQHDLPVAALSERIAKDPIVAAEVLRMAGSAYYSRMGPVQDLAQAIQRLGVEGLQMAISRVVLRPMYQASPGTLTASVAPRLWEHADALSRHCAGGARQAGLSPFDGYLAGLLLDTGWTVLFHALQRGGQTDLTRFSAEAAAAFQQRAHRLFGRVAETWQITPAFSAFAADAARVPLGQSHDPMATTLRTAQSLCMLELATAAA